MRYNPADRNVAVSHQYDYLQKISASVSTFKQFFWRGLFTTLSGYREWCKLQQCQRRAKRSLHNFSKFIRNPRSKKMFRQTARFTARVATAHQRRAYSSQNSQRTVTSSNFAKAVGGGILIFVAFKPTESHNAGLFSSSPAPVDFKKVRSDLSAAIEAEDAKRGDGTSIAPTLVRLAWHASGTYSIFDKTGGSNGATMRFKPDAEWGANAGLKVARDFVDGIVKKHPGLSVADAWTLAGGMQDFLFYSVYF